MFLHLHAIVLLAIVAFATSAKDVGKLIAEQSDCTCSNPRYCDPVTASDRKEIFGFAVTAEYYKQFDWNKLTTVAVYENVLKKYGMEFVCHAHQHNVRVLITTSISKDQIRNATARAADVKKYFAITQKYFLDGADIDVEFLTYEPDLSRGLTEYVKETSEIHKSANPHSLVVTDVPWLPDIYQGHDTWALAEYSDFLFIMAYDEQPTIPPCLARANAPLRNTKIGAKLFLDIGIPAHKLVLGLPWYGYRFNCTWLSKEGFCVSTRRNFLCIRQSMNYGEISALLSNSVGVQQWSDWYESPFMNYKMSGDMQQVWYDDAKSLRMKYQVAEQFGLRGVGMWTLDSLNYANVSDATTKQMWDALPNYSHSILQETISYL